MNTCSEIKADYAIECIDHVYQRPISAFGTQLELVFSLNKRDLKFLKNYTKDKFIRIQGKDYKIIAPYTIPLESTKGKYLVKLTIGEFTK